MTAPDGGEDSASQARQPLFPERQGHHRRRLADVARLLPFLGAAMLALPLLWPDTGDGADARSLSSAMFYIFACWGILILISVIFGFAARRMVARENPEPGAERWPR